MSRDYDDDYDEEGSRRWVKLLGGALLIAGIAAAGFFVFKGEDPSHAQFNTSEVTEPTAGSSVPDSTVAAPTTTERTDASGTTDGPVAQDRPMSGPSADGDTDTTSTTEPPTSVPAADSDDAGPPVSSTPTAPSSPASPTQDPSPTTTTTPVAAGDYPMNPDGTPLPAIVIYDTDTITLSGMLPSQAAKDRLALLAKANSKTDAELINNVIVNPNVPISVGVRVIELNSARFPEGTAQILAAHASELERVAKVMEALPNISVLVIGHADQRGTEAANFAISDERARAVVNFLRYLGISSTRVSSRAVGDNDLLTLDNDDAAFALNRRTEFIFFGLFVE